MEAELTVGAEIELLLTMGTDLVQKFSQQQLARQKRHDRQEKKRRSKQGDARGVIVGTEEEAEEPGIAGTEAAEIAAEDSEFASGYQLWYSVSIGLMGEFAPERLEEFKSYYQPDRKRGDVTDSNYVVQDWLWGRGFEVDGSRYPWAAVGRCILNQVAILKAVKDRLAWQSASTTDHSRRGIQLDLLQIARDLIKVNERAAGVMAGRVLELFLNELAASHEVKLRKRFPPLRELFDALKDAGILDIPVHAQGIWAAEIASRCRAEGESPTKVQVRDLIDTSHWLITNIF